MFGVSFVAFLIDSVINRHEFEWIFIPLILVMYLISGSLLNFGLGLLALFRGQIRVFTAYVMLSILLFGLLQGIFFIAGPMPADL